MARKMINVGQMIFCFCLLIYTVFYPASLWLVKEGQGQAVCEVGTPVKCGDVIRFEHSDTQKNLHSHLFRAPLSGNQEVSGFGENGIGDTGDNWRIVCDSSTESHWQRGKPISLQHADTQKFLITSEAHKFNHQNCGGNCPILDQTEVSAASRKDANAKWQTDQGIYFPSKDAVRTDDDDDDL
jgi:dolichyl-phosphate-mannose--protein O-mannosyl transferase